MTTSALVLSHLVTFAGLGLSAVALVIMTRARRRIDALAERVAILEARAADHRATLRQPRTSAPVHRVDRGPVAVGPILITVPNLAAPSGENAPPDLASSDLGRRFAEIWELVDGGASAESIARSTGQPIGQVELILGLRRQLVATGGPHLP